MKNLLSTLCYKIGLFKIDKTDFFEYLKRLNDDFAENVLKLKNLDNENHKESVFEIKIFLFVISNKILREKFTEKQFSESINFYINEIIFDSSVSNLIGKNNIRNFIDERCSFHHNGLIEFSKIHKNKKYHPMPKDYSQVLYTIFFKSPLVKMDEIDFMPDLTNPFPPLENHLTIMSLFKFSIPFYQKSLERFIFYTKKW